MYKYIGLLHRAPAPHREPALSDGFMVNGSASLESLAHVYGLSVPGEDPRMSVGEYLSRRCCGQPRIGESAGWERIEMVIQELTDGVVSKVRLSILALRERRRWRERRVSQGPAYGTPRSARDRRTGS